MLDHSMDHPLTVAAAPGGVYLVHAAALLAMSFSWALCGLGAATWRRHAKEGGGAWALGTLGP